ncbi:MAG: phosphoribosylformylglycinamidine synthase subunit PurS [Chloroflexota bacterium]
MTVQAYAARITVRLNAGVNDPQGNTVRDGLTALGHGSVRDVRVGKTIDLVVDAESAEAARSAVGEMCRGLLANPVIETYEVSITEVGQG